MGIGGVVIQPAVDRHNPTMTQIDLETYDMNPTAVAAAMLERGFLQLLAPDALDDGPVGPPSITTSARIRTAGRLGPEV